MTDILKQRLPSPQNLRCAAYSSEGEGSPIIQPISKTNDTTKINYNNNLDNDRHFIRETTITSESWARRL